jgi:hypothetical protein
MKRHLGIAFAMAFALGICGRASADEKDATGVLDKAINAVGGAEKLDKADTFTVKAKGKMTFNDNTNEFTTQTTVQGFDHYRGEFNGEFNGEPFKGITVVDGKKGWRKFGDMKMDMDEDQLANEKRSIYLRIIPDRLTKLKGKDFRVEASGEEKVGDAPANVLKVTGPDGKDFTLHFDKESGLLVKSVAKVAGFGGQEFTQETTYGNYKDFDGIKKATKIDAKRDGQTFIQQEITDFKVLSELPANTFAEPE